MCASDMTDWTNISGDLCAWPLNLTIGNIWKDILHTPNQCAWILVSLIPCPLKGAKNINEVWHSAVGTVRSQLRHLDITGSGLKWDCEDGFQQQCYPCLAAWVGDHLEQVMVHQLSYGSCPMCEFPTGVLMGLSTFWPLGNSSVQHLCSELLEDNILDALHTLGLHPIGNQFWQYPLRNVYWPWQPDELYQLLLCLVKDLLHCLLKYLKARQVKDQFDNWFTLVPRYPGLHHFPKPFDLLKSGTRQGTEIRGMIRTLAVHCAPKLVCSKDDGKTAVDKATNEMAMGVVRA